MRFWDLDRRELWFDEAISVDIVARADTGDLMTFVDDNKPPLYSLLLRGWMELFGAHEFAVRSFSVVCGILAMLLAWLLARELLGAGGAVVAAWLFALSPLAVHYGREARNYSLLMAALTASCWLLERALREPRRVRWWVLYVIALAATIFTHYHAGLVLGAHLIQVISRRPVEWKRWGAAVVATGAAFIPWLPVFFRQLSGVPKGMSWLEPFWLAYPPLLAIPRSLVAFTPGGEVPAFVGMTTHAALQPLVVAILVAVVLLALLPSTTKGLEPRRDRAVVVLGAAVLVPLSGIWIASFVMAPVYALGRTDTHVLPLFCVLLAAGLDRLSRPVARLVATAVLLLLGLLTIPVADKDVRGSEREAFATLQRGLAAGDLVICAGYSGPTAAYYLEHRDPGSGVEVRHFPENLSGNPRSGEPDAFSDTFFLAESEDVAWQAERTLARGRRVLVLGTRSPAKEWLVAALEKRFRVEHLRELDYRVSRIEIPVSVLEARRRLR